MTQSTGPEFQHHLLALAQISLHEGFARMAETEMRDIDLCIGFQSEWGAAVHAGYRSLTSTAKLQAYAAILSLNSNAKCNTPRPV